MCFTIQTFDSAILEAKLNSVPEIAQSLGGAPSSDPVNTEHLQTAEHPQPQPVGNGDTNKVENADGENAVAAGCITFFLWFKVNINPHFFL